MSQIEKERVLKLIELACGADENEARNAALRACKLIKKHKLLVIIPEELVTFVTGPSSDDDSILPRAVNRRRRSRKVQDIVSSAAGDVVSTVLRDVLRGR